MRKRTSLILPLAIAAACALTAPASASTARVQVTGDCDPALTPAMQRQAERFAQVAREEGVVGSSLEIRHQGRSCGRIHYGHADLESARLADDDTIYHWASNTKMLLGVAVLQLRDQGLVSLDDPIVRYLPAARAIHNPFGPIEQITLAHLLTHSAGLRSGTFPWRGDNDWAPHEPAEWSQVEAMMPYTNIEFAPGSRTQYSNLGSSMLGRMIEVVTGDNIESYLTKNVLMPLGMGRSYFDVSPRHLLPQRSNNYMLRDGKPQAQGLDFDTGATVANGGLNAPFADIARWSDFLLGLNDTGHHDTVLSRASLQEMFEARLDMSSSGEAWDMGYKFWSRPVPGAPGSRMIGHTGGQKAFTTFIYVLPDQGLSLIYANNTQNPSAKTPRRAMVDARDTALTQLLPALKQVAGQ